MPLSLGYMKKGNVIGMKPLISAMLGLLLFFSGCIEPSRKNEAPPPILTDSISERPLKEAFDDNHWSTRPQDQAITIVGIAGRKANKDEAINDALTDAARRLSLYYGVYGESTAILMEGSNLLEYYANINYTLDIRHDPESYIDLLTFDSEKDVYQKEGSVYVRTRYSGVQNIPSYKSEMNGGMPDWVLNQQVAIPGFLVGVGVSKNKGSLQKTYIASYEIALVSLLSNLSSRTEETLIDVPGRGRITQNVSKSRGTLTSVMILETWYDKKSKAVWTLLVAKAG